MSLERITISEYAKVKGVSSQAVYKKLSTTLKDFVIVDNGRKYLSVHILSESERKKLSTLSTNVANEVVNPSSTDSTFSTPEKPDNPVIAVFTEQLKEKDEQIKSLFDQIKILTEQNKELSNTLTEQNKELLRLMGNSQVLLLNEQNSQQQTAPDTIESTDKKQNILLRLFSRKK